jgi:hypothetical protein
VPGNETPTTRATRRLAWAGSGGRRPWVPRWAKTTLIRARRRAIWARLHAKLLRNRILWSLQGVLYFPPRILVVQIEHPTLGMFAHLRWCLDFLCLCEEHGLEPYFILASPQYRDPPRGPNWFDYFFVHAHLSEEDRKVVDERIARGQVRRIRWSDDILYRAYDDELTLQEAHRLLQKYIRIQPWVQEKVDQFARRHLDGRHVLGVHYRGTDRGSEAPKASYDSMADLVRRYLEHVPATDAVFVATDESEFVLYMQERFRGVEVLRYQATQISDDDTPIHRMAGGDPYLRGEEALLDCLLLSRCSYLIKCPSLLSAWSVLLAPDLPVTMVNSRYASARAFPDDLFPIDNIPHAKAAR